MGEEEALRRSHKGQVFGIYPDRSGVQQMTIVTANTQRNADEDGLTLEAPAPIGLEPDVSEYRKLLSPEARKRLEERRR